MKKIILLSLITCTAIFADGGIDMMKKVAEAEGKKVVITEVKDAVEAATEEENTSVVKEKLEERVPQS